MRERGEQERDAFLEKISDFRVHHHESTAREELVRVVSACCYMVMIQRRPHSSAISKFHPVRKLPFPLLFCLACFLLSPLLSSCYPSLLSPHLPCSLPCSLGHFRLLGFHLAVCRPLSGPRPFRSPPTCGHSWRDCHPWRDVIFLLELGTTGSRVDVFSYHRLGPKPCRLCERGPLREGIHVLSVGRPVIRPVCIHFKGNLVDKVLDHSATH